MADTWIDLHIRIRPDQKVALDKKHPHNLTSTLRDLIDTYLESCKPDTVQLDELNSEIEERNTTIASLSAQRDQLIKKINKSQQNMKEISKEVR